MNNRIDTIITQETLAAIDANLADIRAKLPFLIDLDADERSSLFKMGARSQGFVRAAANLAEQNIDILPRKFDPADLRADVVLYDQLVALTAKLAKITELLEDTAMLAGAEAMAGALVVYDSARRHGKGEALDGSMDDLTKRFKRRSREDPPAAEGDNTPGNTPPPAK